MLMTDFGMPSALDVAQPERVLAVIPALNESRHIEACIRSLMTGDAASRDIALVVADGGSTDDTVAIVERLTAEFPNLRVIANPKRLQAAAINLAASDCATSETRYLLRCDAHSIYPPNFILDVAATMIRTGAASVVVPMDAVGETCFEKGNAWIVDTPLGSGGSRHRGGRQSGFVDHGHHAGFDIDWFRRIGGYDETFSHNEDAEYDARLLKAGGRVYLDAGIRIQYIPRGSVGGLARQYFNYGKGRARNMRKNGTRLKLRHAMPLFALLGAAGGLVAAPVFPPALVLPASYAGLLIIASLVMMVLKASVCGLFSGLASGTMHMSWALGYLKGSLWRDN